MEDEPSLPLKWGDRRLEMTPRNSILYTFMGRTAVTSANETFEANNEVFNHVWIVTGENRGMYFWAEHDPEEYAQMAHFMVEHSFPMLLNNREVPACDVQAWLDEVDKEVETFVLAIPDEL